MESVLDKPITLSLNAIWQPIRQVSVRQAIIAMNSIAKKGVDQAAVGLDIEYAETETGEVDFSKPTSITPVKWNEWVKLPIRKYDEIVMGAKGPIRAPTVVVSVHYNKMPLKTFRPTKTSLYRREGGKCAYTGRELTLKEATIDHIIPRSKGGKNTWQNQVICAPEVNFKKGNKSNKEAGLKLLKKPVEPTPISVAALITEARHRDHNLFLVKNQ